MSIKYYDKSGATPEEKLLAGISPVDAILSPTSKNAIQNKAVYNALRDKLEAATTDLINYYLKTDVYNKSEVRALIGAVETLTMEVVNALPSSDISTTTIYLLKQAGTTNYDQYVYISNEWVKIGTTSIDLSGYVTTSQLSLAIADFLTETEINLLLADKQDKALSSPVTIGSESVGTVEDAIDEIVGVIPDGASTSNKLATASDISGKQDALTFDNVPTASSNNPVKSGGVYTSELDIYKVIGQNGAKNLLPNTAVSNTFFTVNPDGSITCNTTHTAWTQIYLTRNTVLPAGDYILSSTNTLATGEWITIINDATDASIGNVSPGTNSKSFTLSQTTTIRVYFGIEAGTHNITIYPMIRLATDTDSTYQPYSLTNQQISPYVQAISNPNLLDNPWFTVNQRGRTTYGNSMNGFSVDRWYKNLNISLDVIDNGVRLTKKATSNPTLYQKIEASPYLLGKTVTLSVMTTDGKIRSCTGTFPSTFPSSGNIIVVNFDDDIISFRLQAVSTFNPYFIATLDTENCAIDEYLDIRAVKLELGTVSTLAMDTAPNYQQELAKCQRYFERVSFPQNGSVGIAFAMDTSNATMYVPIAPKRVWASVSANVLSKIKYSRGPQASGVACTALAVHSMQSHYIMLRLSGTFTQGEQYVIYNDNEAGNYIDFSAEL